MELISVKRKENHLFTIKVRNHCVDSDLGKDDGGADGAASPSELLVGSLGACIAIMTSRYCAKHGYSDGDVEVSLTYELGDKPKRVSAIVVDLEIPRDVPEERHGAIRRIASLCPIHGTLTHPPKIDVEIV